MQPPRVFSAVPKICCASLPRDSLCDARWARRCSSWSKGPEKRTTKGIEKAKETSHIRFPIVWLRHRIQICNRFLSINACSMALASPQQTLLFFYCSFNFSLYLFVYSFNFLPQKRAESGSPHAADTLLQEMAAMLSQLLLQDGTSSMEITINQILRHQKRVVVV